MDARVSVIGKRRCKAEIDDCALRGAVLGVVLNELGVGRIESDLSFERFQGWGIGLLPQTQVFKDLFDHRGLVN